MDRSTSLISDICESMVIKNTTTISLQCKVNK